jgi:translation initiation factor IF-3
MSYNQPFRPKFIEPKEIHLIGLDGSNMGVISYEEAKDIALKEKCDLIKVSDKAVPPIYKLGDYGKIKYLEEKKQRKEQLKQRQDMEKTVRINFNEGIHDLETKAKRVTEFLNEGRRVRIEMRLAGREKAHADISREKFMVFMNLIKEPFKYFKNVSSMPGGCETTIMKEKN